MVTCKGRAPVPEHTREAPPINVWSGDVLHDEAEPASGQCRSEHKGMTVEGELAFDSDPQLAAILLELLGVEAAGGQMALVDAVMLD